MRIVLRDICVNLSRIADNVCAYQYRIMHLLRAIAADGDHNDRFKLCVYLRNRALSYRNAQICNITQIVICVCLSSSVAYYIA